VETWREVDGCPQIAAGGANLNGILVLKDFQGAAFFYPQHQIAALTPFLHRRTLGLGRHPGFRIDNDNFGISRTPGEQTALSRGDPFAFLCRAVP